jgi:hypothetical protein
MKKFKFGLLALLLSFSIVLSNVLGVFADLVDQTIYADHETFVEPIGDVSESASDEVVSLTEEELKQLPKDSKSGVPLILLMKQEYEKTKKKGAKTKNHSHTGESNNLPITLL